MRMTRALPLAAALVATATVAVGLWLDARGTLLGVPHPPFIGAYGPRAHALVWLALPAFAATVALTPRLLRAPPAVLAAALFGLTLVLRLVLAAARQGTFAWERAFVVGQRGEGKNEYLPSLAAFDHGPRYVLDRFAELVPALPVHSAGHPPGLLLTMHWLSLDSAPRLAWFCLLVGALSAPLAYALGRRVLDERGARLAGLLTALSPAALHFGATSADAVFLTLGLVAAVALLARPLVGAIVLAVVSLFAWSLLAVGAWAAILLLSRDGFRPALRLAILCGVALLGFHALLALATGWDPIGTLRATHSVYELGIASRRPYAYWLFGSPTAFLLILGAPIAWLALSRIRSPEGIAIFAVIATAAVLGFTKAETERIWLFLVPFVCLAAAPAVRRPRVLAALLAVQALAYELVFDTLW
jgi:hypothetical protein